MAPRRLYFTALAFCLSAFGAVAASAQTGAIRTWTSKNTVTVGDTLTYHVDVIAPDSAGVLFGPPVPQLGEFESLRHITRPKRELVGGMALWSEEHVVAVYSPGVHSIPPVEVTVVDPDGKMWALVGDSVRVAVESVLMDGDETLRDIKGLASKPSRGLRPWMILAGAGAALALAVWFWVRRRGRVPIPVEAGPTVPADIAALQRLDALLSARLLEAGKFKAFYTELSDIVRDYVHGRHSLTAQEMTTTELAEGMERMGLPYVFRSDTCLILDESDMVKFAKVRPGVEKAYETALRAKTLIERSGSREEKTPEALAS